ncbi:MAG: hypothetical protein ACO25F_09280 [Erythrobacter sp.]
MDINQLFAQHQRALFAADGAGSSEVRQTYFDLVEYYAKRIGDYRKDLRLPAYRWR